MSKYHAVPTIVDGIRFPSKHEAKRYVELKLLARLGQIQELELQPTYTIRIEGEEVCKVRLDFRYKEKGEVIVEDAKGMDNPLSKMKRKLVEAQHKIKVRLV